MKNKCEGGVKYLKTLVFLILVSGSVMSCGGLFNTEPFVDMHTDKDGNELIADTPRMWENFVALTKRRIEREINNERPPGTDSWNEHWIDTIETKRKLRQNPSKYIEYIINQRRKAGLPELKGSY